jgi:uncharacterized membrane protein
VTGGSGAPGSAELGRVEAGSLEALIARLLTIGTYASVVLVAVGVVALVATGHSPLEVAPALDPGSFVDDLVALKPGPFLWLGIFLVVGTPSARVIAALVRYLRAGEREMAFVAALILAVVAIGVVVGTAGG